MVLDLCVTIDGHLQVYCKYSVVRLLCVSRPRGATSEHSLFSQEKDEMQT